VRLPAYAPELNPAEGAWAAMKASLGNLAVRDVDQLAAIMKNRLKRIQYRQYRPALTEAFLAQTGLTFEPQPLALRPSPVAALNRSVAIAELHGPAEGLDALAEIDPAALENYQPYHAARADLLARAAATTRR
jgi:transposase